MKRTTIYKADDAWHVDCYCPEEIPPSAKYAGAAGRLHRHILAHHEGE